MSEKFLNQNGVKILWDLFKDNSPKRDNHYNYADDFIAKKGQVCFVDTPSDGLQVKVGDGVTQWKDLLYLTASNTQAGLTKLYKETGVNEDGAMTQKSVTDELSKKISVQLDNSDKELLVFTK